MKIALVGYGKMGQTIEEICKSRGHETISIDPMSPKATFNSIDSADFTGVDVCIEFTHPSVVIENIKKLLEKKQKVVVGTTAWWQHLPEIKKIIESTDGTLLYSSNFSLGVNIFFKIVEQAAKLINRFDNYDIAGLEFHHNQKADSPSGTAASIADILIKNIERKTKTEFGIVDRKIEKEELHFASVRLGQIPGTHEVLFDSDADTISLKHTARSRTGFALGSVLAAEWISNQKGLLTLEDYFNFLVG